MNTGEKIAAKIGFAVVCLIGGALIATIIGYCCVMGAYIGAVCCVSIERIKTANDATKPSETNEESTVNESEWKSEDRHWAADGEKPRTTFASELLEGEAKWLKSKVAYRQIEDAEE